MQRALSQLRAEVTAMRAGAGRTQQVVRPNLVVPAADPSPAHTPFYVRAFAQRSSASGTPKSPDAAVQMATLPVHR
eukprot:12108417-Alexandrium_andersonii.AAC.1